MLPLALAPLLLPEEHSELRTAHWPPEEDEGKGEPSCYHSKAQPRSARSQAHEQADPETGRGAGPSQTRPTSPQRGEQAHLR